MKLLITLLIWALMGVGYAFSQRTESAKVTSITDGDTITVLINGKYEKVRLIGVNTPELKDERPMVRCFAIAAKMFAHENLIGRHVRLESDPTQADKDRYGRLLRYVFWNDGNFNEYIIKQGFAYEYTYGRPYKYQKEFKKAQKYSEESKWGLWDPKECI